MPFGGRFLKRLCQSVAMTAALAVGGEAHAQQPPSGFLFGFRDENGMTHLYGTNVEGHDFHCGEHPLVGCVPVYDRGRNFLGYWHYTGQWGYVCHWGRREVSPYTHLGDIEQPETLFYPCPTFVVPHHCGLPHFTGVPAAYTVPFPSAPAQGGHGLVYKDVFHLDQSKESSFPLRSGRRYEIRKTLTSAMFCSNNWARPDLSWCDVSPAPSLLGWGIIDLDERESSSAECKHLYQGACSVESGDRNAWLRFDAHKDHYANFIHVADAHPHVRYTGTIAVEIYDLGPSGK